MLLHQPQQASFTGQGTHAYAILCDKVTNLGRGISASLHKRKSTMFAAPTFSQYTVEYRSDV